MLNLFAEDIKRYFDLMGIQKTEVTQFDCIKYFFNPRMMPVGIYRIASFLYNKKFTFLARFFTSLNLFLFGIEIAPRIQIGGGLFFPHTVGTVIGAESIGRNATIYQGVTLAASFLDMNFDPSTRPIVGDNVFIGAGAKVLGGIQISSDVKIGANALVIRNVPCGVKVLAPEGMIK